MVRNQNFELVRIIAAFGIVLFHSGATGAQAGYGGLIAFAALSTMFAGSDIAKLSKRVLIPWVFWSVFYLGWRYAGNGSPFHEGLSPLQSIFYGSHLWYLPFIFVANIAVSRLTTRHAPVICGVIALALLAGGPWWREFQATFDPPLAQFLHALPAVFLGVAFRSKLGIALSAVGLAICTYWQVGSVSLPYAVGGGAVIAALLLPRLRLNLEPISSCMLGVYLVHIAALGVLNQILGQGQIVTVAAAFLGSLLGVWAVRRWIPITKHVLG